MGYPVCNSTLEDMRLVEVPIVHGLTVHELLLVIAGVATIVALLLSVIQILLHGARYLEPNQQKHVVRILFMVPVYGISNFLAAFYYYHEIYFILVGNAYAAFGLASFFSLLSHYIAQDLHHQKQYFRSIQPRPWRWPVPWFQKCCGGDRGRLRTPRSGLTYFNVVFVGVFQYCFVLLTTSIIGSITHVFERYCPSSLNPAFAHIWIIVINTISAIISSYCLDQYHSQISKDVARWKTKFQFRCINIVLYLSTYQTLLIAILVNTGAIKPSPAMQTPDLKVALPATLLCVEMAIVSVLHLFAYSSKPYVIGSKENRENMTDRPSPTAYQGGLLGLKALADAVNPWDFVKATSRAAKWMFRDHRVRHNDVSYTSRPLRPNTDPIFYSPVDFPYDYNGHEGHELLSTSAPGPGSAPVPSRVPSCVPRPPQHYSNEDIQFDNFNSTYQNPYLYDHYLDQQPDHGYYWSGDLADQRPRPH